MPSYIPLITTSILFILQCAFNIPTSLGSETELNYRLKERWSNSDVTIFPIDINEDGLDELAIQSNDQMDIIDADLNFYERSFRISGPDNYMISALLPARNGSPPFLASYYDRDSCVHKILLSTSMTRGKSIPIDSLRPFITFYRPDSSSQYDFKQTINMLACFKNKAGRKITLFQKLTSWDANGNRGLIAYDIYAGEILWERDFASIIYCFQIDDIDGDNEGEIILGLYANQNGVNLGGTTDDSSYVIVYEADGREKWKRSIGPGWTGAWVGLGNFVENRGKNLVVYQYSKRKTDPNQDKIQILDANTGETIVSPKRIGNQFTQPRNKKLNICQDFNGDGADEIVIGNTDGFVRLLNGELTEIEHSESFEKKPVRVDAVADFDGDGLLEIVCVVPRERIVILNHQLKTLYSYPLPEPDNIQINIVRGETKSLLLTSHYKDGVGVYRLFELQRSIYPFETVEKAKNITAWVIAACIFVLIIIFIRNLFFGTRAQRILPDLLMQANLMQHCLLVNKKGTVREVGQLWETLLQIPSYHSKETHCEELFQTEWLRSVKSVITDFFERRATERSLRILVGQDGEQIAIKLKSIYLPEVKSFCFMIFDMSEEEHIRQVKHWAQVAQRLAHGIKNPLTTVKLNAEELKHVLEKRCQHKLPDIDDYFDAMIHQVNKLKKMSDGFMQFVEFEKPTLKSADLNELTQELVYLWKPEKTTGIKIEWDLDDNLPPTLLDPQQFEFALKNIFFNAVESMPKGGAIIISSRTVDVLKDKTASGLAMNYNELQIQDTGAGIPPEFLDKVTQPYFTRNKIEGTGLGLSIVQKIMDSHGGQLDIFSELNVGTTITLRFRPLRSE